MTLMIGDGLIWK